MQEKYMVIRARHLNCADKYILVEHSDLIGFGYDLSDTKNKTWVVGEMGFTFCGKDHSCKV